VRATTSLIPMSQNSRGPARRRTLEQIPSNRVNERGERAA
jgi:hypothetical protein